MDFLSRQPHLFVYWWVIKAPKHLFTVVKRIIILVNNMVSFTLNIRLLFTPLFGDYTIVGRFIGFVVRIVEIIGGSVIMVMLAIVALVLPVIWWVGPFYLLFDMKLWIIPTAGLTYVGWAWINQDIPTKRIHQVEGDKCINSDRNAICNFIIFK